jgi:uncharacterized protein YndB with AHSA1/START domain
MAEPGIHCEPLRCNGAYLKGVMTLHTPHTPDAVWAALTEPERLVDWLAPGEIELRPGGAVRLDFEQSGVVIDSQVLRLNPPTTLSYSWSRPGEPLRPIDWTLVADGEEGSRLTLCVQVPGGEDAARACAGWAAHLEMLAACLEGVPVKFPFETFQARRAAYAAGHAPSD